MAPRRANPIPAAALCALTLVGAPAIASAPVMGPPAPRVHAPSANTSGLVAEPVGVESAPAAVMWDLGGPIGPPAEPVAPGSDRSWGVGTKRQTESAPAAATESLPLGVGSTGPAGEAAGSKADGPFEGGAGWLVRTAGALGLVIALAVLLRTALVRASRGVGGIGAQLGAGGRAPSGLLSVLGRYPVARGQTLVLLKVDTRVLLLCQSSEGFSTLSEISDPEEVASILLKARDEENESLGKRFGSMLRLFERDPTITGDADGVEIDVLPRGAPSSAFAGSGPRPMQEGPLDAVGSLRRRLASMQEAVE